MTFAYSFFIDKKFANGPFQYIFKMRSDKEIVVVLNSFHLRMRNQIIEYFQYKMKHNIKSVIRLWISVTAVWE